MSSSASIDIYTRNTEFCVFGYNVHLTIETSGDEDITCIYNYSISGDTISLQIGVVTSYWGFETAPMFTITKAQVEDYLENGTPIYISGWGSEYNDFKNCTTCSYEVEETLSAYSSVPISNVDSGFAVSLLLCLVCVLLIVKKGGK